MRIDVIPAGGRYFRANLHCHTTVSDGQLTPEEVKAHYKAYGYQVVAYTDHRNMVDHSDLNDPDFLALTGFEMDFTEGTSATPCKFRKTCHINLISPEPHRAHREDAKGYSPEIVNAYIQWGHENGYLVHYNHPEWSVEDQNDYNRYEGFDGMEIYNHGCYLGGWHEENAVAYEYMLKKNGKLFCLATDDNHTALDMCGGYVMIKAPELSYGAIFDALKNGAYYASWGARIDGAYIEDGVFHVTTPGAREVAFTTGIRHAHRVIAAEGESLKHAAFQIDPADVFVKAEVIDEAGRRAYTNAWFL